MSVSPTHDLPQADLDAFIRFFGSSSTGAVLVGLDQRFRVCNTAFAAFLGTTPTELAGRTIAEVTFPTDHNLCEAAMKALLDGAKDQPQITKRFLRPDGSIVWGRTTITLLASDDKTPLGFLTVVQDLTDLMETERSLREKDLIFEALLEHSPVYVFFKDHDIRAIHLSRNFETMVGMPLEQILGKTMDELFPSELAKSMIEADKKILFEGKLIQIDEELHGKYYTTIKFPISRPPKQPLLAGFTIDITERKLMEKALQESEKRYRQIVENTIDALIVHDFNGRVLDVNDNTCRLIGFSREELLAMHLPDMSRPGEPKRVEALLAELIARGSILFEGYITHHDGRRILVQVSSKVVSSEGNGVIQGFMRDITTIRKNEEALQTMQKLDALGVLAGGIAHDFNNLLGGIYGNIDLAQLKCTDPDVSGYLTRTLETLDRARGLTRQLLTFAKGGAPALVTSPLMPFIQETVAFALSGSAVSCRLNVAPNLWASRFDRGQIAQVIDNLIINALQAMPMGGSLTIALTNVVLEAETALPLSPGRFVKISIADTGIGIPANILPRIFDPFFSTKAKGHGLGLATSFSIVSRHGGTMQVESEPGVGSTFHVLLPATVPDSDSPLPTAPEFSGSGCILIMDDEEVVLSVLGQFVKVLGYSSVMAKDGKEAIEVFSREQSLGGRFAAVILDLTVPGGMGGKEALLEIRKLDNTIPVFVSSGYADDPVLADPAKYGFTDAIPKPSTINDLKAILARHLASDHRR